MKVLIACEYSGRVRDAFIALGHNAVSCDLLPSEQLGPHIQGDIRDALKTEWDLVIAHPPCTYLTVTGNKWFKPEFRSRFPTREADRELAVLFFMYFANLNTKRIAIENPIGIMSSRFRKPDQIIQPFWFGDPSRKATCLWLKNLPLLVPTTRVVPNIKKYRDGSTVSADYAFRSWKDRSRTYLGIANAMATQWGGPKC